MPETMYPEDILIFIQAPQHDFDEGLQLFIKYSNNRAVLHYLMRKRDHDKLMYELHKMSKTKGLKPVRQFHKVPAIVQRQADAAKAAATVVDESPADADILDDDSDSDADPVQSRKSIRREDLHPDMQVLWDQNAEYYKLQRVYHEKMKLAATDEDRAAMRQKVVELDDQIAANFNTINSFDPATAVAETTPVADQPALHKQINAARTSITRILQKYDPSKKADLLAKLEFLAANNAAVSEKTQAKLIQLNVIEKGANTVGQ